MDKKSFSRFKKGTKVTSQDFLKEVALMDKEALFEKFASSETGLPNDEDVIEEKRDEFGDNKFSGEKKKPAILRFLGSFVNPFTLMLLVIALVSILTEVVFAGEGEKNYMTFSIIIILVVFSGVLHFVQEAKSSKAMESLISLVETTTAVIRDGVLKEIPIDEVVVGDLIHLGAGDVLPCDGRIIDAKDLFITQSSLTGESESVEKTADAGKKLSKNVTDIPNLVFMGTTVLSGSARMIAVQVGKNTILG